MTDYETAYRALREGVEALHVVAVNPTDWCADWCAACGRAWPCPTIALLAPSPAEGTGEACREASFSEDACGEHGGEWVYEDDGVTVLPECSRADEFRGTTEARCEASGYSVAHCKAIDLCDCFPDGQLHPEAFAIPAPVSSGDLRR